MEEYYALNHGGGLRELVIQREDAAASNHGSSRYTEDAVNNARPIDGAESAAAFSSGWPEGSLRSAVEKFAPGSQGVVAGEKTLYLNDATGIQIVYDNLGNYFRIQDTKLPGKRVYYDLNGEIPNNKMVNGKQMGRTQGEYNQVTHFRNTD